MKGFNLSDGVGEWKEKPIEKWSGYPCIAVLANGGVKIEMHSADAVVCTIESCKPHWTQLSQYRTIRITAFWVVEAKLPCTSG